MDLRYNTCLLRNTYNIINNNNNKIVVYKAGYNETVMSCDTITRTAAILIIVVVVDAMGSYIVIKV